MVGALLYLRLTSLKNLIRSRLLRLRRPKYLIGAIFGAAYFYFFFFRHARAGTGFMAKGGIVTQLPADLTPLLLGLGALAILTIVMGMWVLPSEKPGFNFSEAEIAFLFPAPITRHSLVHYKLLSTLFTSLLQTVFFSLLFNSQSLFTARVLQVVASWWVVLSFFSLHYLGSSLTIARLVESGIGTRRRRTVILGFITLVFGATLLWTWRTLPDIWTAPSLRGWAIEAMNRGPLPWLLWPFRLMIRPFFANGPVQYLLALAPALLVLIAHYFWVARMNVAFEEASIAGAERRAARLAEAIRTGKRTVGAAPTVGRRPPFDLGRSRWPEFAFLWKNLLSTRPWFTPRGWVIAAASLVGIATILQRVMGPSYWMAGGTLATIGAVGAGGVLFYGPLLSRLDLRQDLANADILKTYPLPGWRVVLGELLAPIAILTGFIWLGLLAWLLGLHGHQPPNLSTVWLGPSMRVVFAACFAALTPLVVALELLVPNAAPVVLPGWFQTVRTPGAGIDLMGQRLIFGFGQVFVVMLAMLPAAITAAVLIFCTQWFAGPAFSVCFATLAVMVVLLGELWCGIWWVGGRFEQLDISEART